MHPLSGFIVLTYTLLMSATLYTEASVEGQVSWLRVGMALLPGLLYAIC